MTHLEWVEKVHLLNNHINSLKEWNDYAESCQSDYDWLLKQRPTTCDACKYSTEEKADRPRLLCTITNEYVFPSHFCDKFKVCTNK